MSVAAIAFFAPLDRFRNLVVTDGGNIISDNGHFSTDGAGNILATSVVVTGTSAFGAVQVTSTSSSQTLVNGSTITVPANTGAVLITCAAAVTGIIMPTLTLTDDQELWVINTGANNATFAAAGTSHVADGVADTITGGVAAKMIWDHTTNLWYRA